MFKSGPGTKRWWQETALICTGGMALAAWLWDGPPPIITPIAGTETIAPLSRYDDLPGDWLAFCAQQVDLHALAEDDTARRNCPPVRLLDLPPEQRPFP